MNPNDKPWPIETLAAHADGELNSTDRAFLDAWLLTHPESRKELDGQRLFARKNQLFWNKTAAPHPTEAQWNCVLGKICDSLQPTQPSYQEIKPTRWRNWMAGIATVAMAALIAVKFMGGPPQPAGPGTNGTEVASEDAYAVALDNDVNIISVQGDDGSIIVVGMPPLAGTLEMTTVGDVKLEAIVSDADGQPVKPGTLPADLKKGLYINPADKTTPVP